MHKSVLLDEVIKVLQPERGGVFIDATADGGGHTEAILKNLPDGGIIIAIDQDKEMTLKLRERFNGDPRVECVCDNFRNIANLAANYKGEVNGILYDLGWSSIQLEESGRGFSFLKDEPLLMTYKSSFAPEDLTAAKIINGWSEEDIKNVIKEYGEEKYAARIAKKITEARRKKKIITTAELSQIIKSAVPKNYEKGRVHPATRTFQALRIAVNDELGALEEGLSAGWELLARGGRMAVISFHSLEDRIVKNFLRTKKTAGEAELIVKKPIIPTGEEIKKNPRARSAKLRAAGKA